MIDALNDELAFRIRAANVAESANMFGCRKPGAQRLMIPKRDALPKHTVCIPERQNRHINVMKPFGRNIIWFGGPFQCSGPLGSSPRFRQMGNCSATSNFLLDISAIDAENDAFAGRGAEMLCVRDSSRQRCDSLLEKKEAQW